jgi:cytochrome c biogenesis protein CcdA
MIRMTSNEHAYIFGKLAIGIGVLFMTIGRLFYPDAETVTFWGGIAMIALGWFVVPKWPTPYNGGEL